MFAQRRTVSESKRAVVLMISTGKSNNARNQAPIFLGEPAKVPRYPTGPWCLMPCQLKYRNVKTAHARGTVFSPVGATRKVFGKAPDKLESKTKIETEPTNGIK